MADTGGASIASTPHKTLQFANRTDLLVVDQDAAAPFRAQESEELGDEIVARLSPTTGEIENLEVLFFSTGLLRKEMFELPVTAELRLRQSSSV